MENAIIGEKEVTGYCDCWSVSPGETIQFKVNCDGPDTYRADTVQLICGDTHPDGPGYKEKVVDTPVNGTYSGRKQSIDAGSCVVVPDDPCLRLSAELTLQAFVYPTTPRDGEQGILTKWSATETQGYALLVDEDGSLALRLATGESTTQVDTGTALRESTWYFVAATFDADTGRVRLWQESLPDADREIVYPTNEHAATVTHETNTSQLAGGDVPFVMAGYALDSGVDGQYNGKIAAPRVCDTALNREEMKSLVDEPLSSTDIVAAWDFSAGVTSEGIPDHETVVDVGPHGLDGETINLPTRAVTGHNWTGNEHNFVHAPDEYGAIHFHDDDLVDASWETDFELNVPDEMESAVYAVRLRTDRDEYYIPFFVRPPAGETTADVAFLAPTTSYLAYGNFPNQKTDSGRDNMEPIMGMVPPMQDEDVFLSQHREYGLSLYGTHTDGSGSVYSSRLRPLLNMSPKYKFGFAPPSSLHQLNADLHLTDWLEHLEYEYDVITDENLHREGKPLLEDYRAILTGTHPEYCSEEMWDALSSYQRDGGRMMYLGGNGYYWVTAYHPSNPQVVEVRRGETGTEPWIPEAGQLHHSFTGEKGGLWRTRGRPPQKLTGLGFTGQWEPSGGYYRRNEASFEPEVKFIFEGIGPNEKIGDFGAITGGAAGGEIDCFDPELGSPDHAYLLASSKGHTDSIRHAIEDISGMGLGLTGTMDPEVRSDIVYYKLPGGGAVFSTGSMAWCGSLSHDEYENNVSRITANVLDRFIADDPLP